MAIKTQAQLQAEVNTLLADNTVGGISALDVRTVNTNIVDSLYDVKADKEWVSSRGENLFTNGSLILGNNTSFSAATFDGAQANGSSGAFK